MNTENMACVDCGFSQTCVALESGDVYCKRYPDPVVKSASDWCGEFKQRPPKPKTLDELREELRLQILRIEKKFSPESGCLVALTPSTLERIRAGVSIARKYLARNTTTESDFTNALLYLRRY